MGHNTLQPDTQKGVLLGVDTRQASEKGCDMVGAIPRGQHGEVFLNGIEKWYFLGVNELVDVCSGVDTFADIVALGMNNDTVHCLSRQRTER